jgi:hypothetical protein
MSIRGLTIFFSPCAPRAEVPPADESARSNNSAAPARAAPPAPARAATTNDLIFVLISLRPARAE